MAKESNRSTENDQTNKASYRSISMLTKRDPNTGKLVLTDAGRKFRNKNSTKQPGQ